MQAFLIAPGFNPGTQERFSKRTPKGFNIKSWIDLQNVQWAICVAKQQIGNNGRW